jgi:hypothetical protein
VNWYASANTSQVVQVAPTSELQDGDFPTRARPIRPSSRQHGQRRLQRPRDPRRPEGEHGVLLPRRWRWRWSATYAFKTRKFDGNFDFLFFGDPQIGSSGNVPKGPGGLGGHLKVALAANPEAELLVSGGDQVETAGRRDAVDRLPRTHELRAVPWVATIGNHDVGSRAYEQHLWTPNTDRSPRSTVRQPRTMSGGDYWFIYKGVLFIDLNSNAYATSGQAGVDADQAHIGFITNVVQQHGAEAKYTVLVYHHSIYSPADHANDGDNQKRRLDFPAAFSHSVWTSSCRVTTTATRAAT